MRTSKVTWLALAGVIVLVSALVSTNALAFRMIQRPNTPGGPFHAGSLVACNAPGGFLHWEDRTTLPWRLNPSFQGAGKQAAVNAACAAWTAVTPAPYILPIGVPSTTTAALSGTDGQNVFVWRSTSLCTGSCLAITCLTLRRNQRIRDVDVQFNNSQPWVAAGADPTPPFVNFDVRAVATHEVGHGMGIHHSDVGAAFPALTRPTMQAFYFGPLASTLQADDIAALNCAATRFPPDPPFAPDPEDAEGNELAGDATAAGAALTAAPGRNGMQLSFSLQSNEDVKLEVFDVAGRFVANLLEGHRGAGDHRVAWDGFGPNGRAGSGIYFARLTTSEGVTNAKMFVLR